MSQSHSFDKSYLEDGKDLNLGFLHMIIKDWV